MQKVQGNDCIRFCPGCGKNVYSLYGMTREQATQLIEAKEGNLCLRLHRRSDGTVITSDCPVGQATHRKRVHIGQLVAAVGGLGAAMLAACVLRFNRLGHANSTTAPQIATSTMLAKGVTKTTRLERPEPTAIIPQPTPAARVENPGRFEGEIITNAPSELPHIADPNDSSISVIMGAPPPPPSFPIATQPPSSNSDDVVRLPEPNFTT